MNTLTGYSKSTLTDSYLLTAAGGHKAISDFVTLDSNQTISGVKTFSSQQKFTVAQGTSPFTITSTTKVANLNADLLDGYHETSFFRKRDMSGSNVNFNDYFTNGVYINTTGNGTGNSNVPSTYGYLLAFQGGGSTSYYGGAQIHIGTNGSLQTRAHWDYNWSTWKTILDSNNSSVSGGGSSWGSSITVKINGVEKTLTIPSNPDTWRPITDTYEGTSLSSTTSLSQKGANSLQKNVIAFKRAKVTNENYDANTLLEGVIYNYYSYSAWKNAPTGMQYGKILNLIDGTDKALSGQLAWDVNHASTTDTTRYLWWRATDNGTFSNAKWHRLAYADEIPTIPSLSLGTTTGSGNAVTSISVDGHKITLNKGTTFSVSDHTHTYLVSGATLTGSDHAVALKDYFSANKSSIGRGKLLYYSSSAMSNTSFYMGSFVVGHDTAPYGGFYVAHYDKPYYVGISNGTFTQHQLAKITDVTKSQVGLGNVQNTAFYERIATVNGTNWNMAGTNSTAAFTIYAPTTGGTAGYILKSNKDAAPTWIAQSDISAGKLGGYEESKFLRSKGWTSAGSINDYQYGIYATGTNMTDVPKDANGTSLTYSTVLAFDSQCGSGYGKVQFYIKSAQLYYRHYWDSKWYDWYQIALKSNIPTKVSQLQNDSGYLTTRGYIGTTSVQASSTTQNLTGIGSITMSSALSFSSTGTIKTSTTSNLQLKYNDSDTNSILLTSGSFRPYTASSSKLKLGAYNSLWNGIYLPHASSCLNNTGVNFTNSSGYIIANVGSDGSGIGLYSTGNVYLRGGCTKSSAVDTALTSSNKGMVLDTSGNLTVTGNITASKLIKSGGTSSQFLKADGSVDSNTYLTSHQSLADYVTLNTTQIITGAKSFEGNLIIKRSPSCIWYRNSSNTLWGLLGFSAENTLTMWESDGSTSYEVYHKGNLGLVGANGTTGLIKNGSTVTTTTGLTACPIINGVPYYKGLSQSGVTANTYETYAEKWNSDATYQQLKIPQFTVNSYGILTNAEYTATPIIRTHYISSNQTWTNDKLSFINVFAIIPGVTLTLPGASIENCGKLIFAKKAYQGSAAYISGYITACNSYGTSASTRSIDLVNSSIFVCMNNGSNYSWVHFYCG